MFKPKKIDTGTEQLICEIYENFAVVTLNRPEQKNPLGDEVTPVLREIISKLEINTRLNA